MRRIEDGTVKLISANQTAADGGRGLDEPKARKNRKEVDRNKNTGRGRIQIVPAANRVTGFMTNNDRD